MKFVLAILLFFSFAAQAQDTSYVTYSIQHDSLIQTTIPQKIICRDSSVNILDTNYNVYYNNQIYALVDGSIDATIQVCDTIPAHDTVFVCTLCASHDTTTMVITPTLITLKANNQTKTYGQTFSFTGTGSQVSIVSGGLKPGDVITTDNATSTGAVATAIASSYTITLSSVTIMRGVTNVTSSYSISYQAGALTVAQLPVTITANNQGKTAGQTFTFTNNGSQVTANTLASGDAITADNATSTGAASGAAAGTYAITLSSVGIFKGATNVTSSYNITYVGGTLTVAAAPLVITVTAKNQLKTYGNSFSFLNNGTQVNVTSGSLATGHVITVDNAASTGSGSAAAVGSYGITLSAITIMNGATNVTGSYTITYAPGTLTVNAIPITIQANNQTKTEGETFTFTHNGTQVSVVSGSLLSGNVITVDNAASSGSVSGAADGTYTITLSSVTIMNGVTNVTGNYSITYQAGTLTVLPVVPVQTWNGMLPNYDMDPPLPTLAQRIAYVQSYSCNLYRSAQDPSSAGWQTTFIKGAGLLNTMTYNTDPVQQPSDPFVTAAERPAALAAFGALLRSHIGDLPDLITFQNEEPNTNYWSGPVSDYIAWLNAAADTAHAYGVPCSNGGLLQNVIFYVRWVYQQEGNTAMVNEINQRGLLYPGTGTAAQFYIDWYKQEIPALAASNIDYINQHWYEPALEFGRQRPNSDTTTGLLPIIINFLQERTGKPVIMDEFGTDNASQVLFNQMADEMDQNGVKIRVYYAGDGPVAQEQSQYWEDWINAHSP